MLEKIEVLVVASEARPFAQTGGLAEVAGSLPQALARQGAGVALILPAYQVILSNKNFSFKETGIKFNVAQGKEIIEGSLLRGELAKNVPVYLVRCDTYFDRPGIYDYDGKEHSDNPERFSFFSKAVLEVLDKIDKYPDILLANDWQSGLAVALLKISGRKKPKSVFVIHNQGYLGLVPPEKNWLLGLPSSSYSIDGVEYFGQSSLLKAGIVYSDALITVSPSYAKEVQTPEGGHGLDGAMRHHSGKLVGILNGVDYNVWSPETDKLIAANYSKKNISGKLKCKKELLEVVFGKSDDINKPLVGMVGRLAAQKGFSLVAEAAEDLFRLGIKLIILGSGEPFYEEMARSLVARFPEQCKLFLGYNDVLSHRIFAGSDIILVPSMYEPCGLVQMFAMKYGAVPVVRAVGGLNDTVRDFSGQNPDGLWDTGFKFVQFQSKALFLAMKRAVDLYNRPDDFIAMMKAGMSEDFSWDSSAKKYINLFEQVLSNV